MTEFSSTFALLAISGYADLGTRGWPEHAPYDGIIVAAGGPAVPESLRAQMAVGGRLVMPVGRRRRQQHLVLVTRRADARAGDAGAFSIPQALNPPTARNSAVRSPHIHSTNVAARSGDAAPVHTAAE